MAARFCADLCILKGQVKLWTLKSTVTKVGKSTFGQMQFSLQIDLY